MSLRLRRKSRQSYVPLRGCVGKLVDDFECTEQFAGACTQRHTDERVCLIAQLPIDVAVDLPLLIKVGAGHAPSDPLLNDLPNNSGVVGDPELSSLDAERGSADEQMIWLIPKKDAGAVGVEEPSSGLGHLFKKRNQFVCLVPLRGNIEDCLQLFIAAASASFSRELARAAAKVAASASRVATAAVVGLATCPQAHPRPRPAEQAERQSMNPRTTQLRGRALPTIN